MILSETEEKTMIMYAIRYSLGRKTGALSDCISVFKKRKHLFKDWELKAILDDLNYQININQQVKEEFICNSSLIGFRSIVCGILQDMEDFNGKFCG